MIKIFELRNPHTYAPLCPLYAYRTWVKLQVYKQIPCRVCIAPVEEAEEPEDPEDEEEDE